MRNPRIKNEDKNVWLKGNRMKQYFPTIVKKFNSRKFGGKRVDDAQETILNPNGCELVDGYVSFYSTMSDVAKVIQRTAKAIKSMKITYDGDKNITGVDFLIEKDAFRASTFAFNTKYAPDESYETDRKLTQEQINKMQKGRKNAQKKK